MKDGKTWRQRKAEAKKEKLLRGGEVLAPDPGQNELVTGKEDSDFLKKRIEVLESHHDERDGLTVNSNIQHL